jgi:hypothetical protein
MKFSTLQYLSVRLAAVPEAIEAIGLLATFGHETGVHHQGLFMRRGNHRGDGGLIEGDTVNVPGLPT